MDLASVRTDDASRPVRVAVDAMGGDHAPLEVVVGALTFARRAPADEVLLVGDEAAIRAVADGPLPSNVTIERSGSVIGMDEAPAVALRTKKDASIVVAMDLVSGVARTRSSPPATPAPAWRPQCCGSAGSPGWTDRRSPSSSSRRRARWSSSTSAPTPIRPRENLYQYAHMGALFAERVPGVPSPTVALLSLGEEKGKGDARVQRATELLDASTLRFIGNVEGKDLVHHPADVVVCDAMLGNVTMKFFEGLSTFIFDLFGRSSAGPRAGRSRTRCSSPASSASAPRSTTRSSAARRCSACAAPSSSPTVGPSAGSSRMASRSRPPRRGRASPRRIAEAFGADGRARAALPEAPRGRGAARRRPGASESPRDRHRLRRTLGRRPHGPARRGGCSRRRPRRARRPGGLARIAPPAVAVRERPTGSTCASPSWRGPATTCASVARDVREAVAATVERLLGLELAEVTVVVDGVGE